MVKLFLLPFYCGLRRVFDTFNFTSGNPPKKKPENVLFPDGWYGMGWDGMGRNIKSDLEFSSDFVGI